MTKRLFLTVFLTVAALLLAACEVEQEGEVTDATLTPDASSTAGQVTPTATPTQATPTATPANSDPEKAQQALEADRAKPRFRGEMGDFVVVESSTGYPCPEPDKPLLNPELSGLRFELPGAVIDKAGSESCQGIVMRIADGGGTTLVGRSYFLGPKLDVSFDAPAERLKLLTTVTQTLYHSGNEPWAKPVPAIAMLPIPDCISCLSEVVAIFDGRIAVWAQSDSLDKATALVQQIMAVESSAGPPLDINGVWLPVPPGASRGGPPICDPPCSPGAEGPTLGVARGRSEILWNNNGVEYEEIAPEDEADFQPFLDGLKKALNVE